MVNGGTFRHLGTPSVEKVPHRHAHRLAHRQSAIFGNFSIPDVCEAAVCLAIGHLGLEWERRAAPATVTELLAKSVVFNEADGFAQRALAIWTAALGTRAARIDHPHSNDLSLEKPLGGWQHSKAQRRRSLRPAPEPCPLRFGRGATYAGQIRIPSPERFKPQR